MEIDLAWLLILPLLFALGWITARYDKGQQGRESRHVTRDVLNGVSAVLADDLLLATESLLQAARSAPDSVDLHRAVGNLYRRRGMPDRAIEVHEIALRNPNLTPQERKAFLLDLGRDFMAAGIFDRAQQTLTRLLSEPAAENQDLDQPSGARARELLLAIAQRTRDWASAIHWALEIQRHGGDFPQGYGFDQLMMHFFCEQAEMALQHGQSDQAAESLRQAAQHAARLASSPRIQEVESKIRGLTPALDASAAAWLCGVCGFRTRQHYWQCPGCHRWDTFGASS